jgi:hypothetical protein
MTTSTHDESTQLRTQNGRGRGQFAGNIPGAPEPSVVLVRPTRQSAAARTALDAACRQTEDAQVNQFRAAESAAREAVLNVFPDAVFARFTGLTKGDVHQLYFDGLSDENRKPFSVRRSNPDAYDKLSDELQGIGQSFTDSEYAESTFGTHQDGLLMNMRGGVRTVGRADADLAEIESQTQLLAARKSAISVEAIALSVRQKFATAQTVHFQHTAFRNQGLTLVAVSDAEGIPVWEMKDWSDDEHFTEANNWRNSFNKYVHGIDKKGSALADSEEEHFGVDLDLGDN